MAGIGFELKKIYGRQTLVSNLWGSVYAAMTTIGPAVISTVLMLVLKLLLDRAGLTIFESRFFVSSTTYAFLIGLLVATFFATPVSRYISDCIYLHKESDIFPSAIGVLSLTTAISGIIMLLLCVGVYYSQDNVSLSYLIAYYFLGVLVTDAYTLMTYASALKHYRALTFSFFLGLLLAIGVYFLCNNWLEIGKIVSACLALVCCYFVVVFALLFQCAKAFGMPRGRYYAFLSYLRRYPMLAIGGFAYMLGLYIPNIIYWFFSDIGEQVSIFYTAPTYDVAMFLALVVNTPSLVIFVVKVETAFYDKYTLYVSALNNGPYKLIQKERLSMNKTLRHQLFFVYEIQLIITVVLVCLISVFLPYLSISTNMLSMFVILSLGVYAVFCMYFTVVVFYYFADYNAACISFVVFLTVTILGSFVTAYINKFYPLPLLLGSLCGWIVSFVLLQHRMKKLDSFLMC